MHTILTLGSVQLKCCDQEIMHLHQYATKGRIILGLCRLLILICTNANIMEFAIILC